MIPLDPGYASTVAINGKIFDPREAVVSVFDRGFLFGDAVYEVTRSYGRILFQLETHVARLYRSAQMISMNLGVTPDQLIDEIYRVVNSTKLENVYVRIQVSRGLSPTSIVPLPNSETTRIIYVKPSAGFSSDLYSRGCDIFISGVERNSKRALDPNIKSGNYLNNILAYIDGQRQFADFCARNSGFKTSGLQEVLMLDADGQINEGCTSNVFMVQRGVLITPPDEANILFGITRKLICEVAEEVQVPVEFRPIAPEELLKADEVFISSSTREVMPVRSVDGVLIQGAPGPLTMRLGSGYKKKIEAYKR